MKAYASGGGGGGGGGDSPIKVVRVPIVFDTPDLVLTGIPIYVPTPGDIFLSIWPFIVTPWDGTTPKGSQGYAGNLNYFSTWDMTLADTDNTFYTSARNLGGFGLWGSDSSFGQANRAKTADPLLVSVDDGSGGDPGSSQGAGEVVLVILKATS